jgi:hypothetical protein
VTAAALQFRTQEGMLREFSKGCNGTTVPPHQDREATRSVRSRALRVGELRREVRTNVAGTKRMAPRQRPWETASRPY